MLILSRLENETVILETPEGRIIRVLVQRIGKNKVRLGFGGDRDVVVAREEVYRSKADREAGEG